MRLALVLAFAAVAASAHGAIVTVSRPIDNFLGHWLDHTYATNQDWQCIATFGGGCDCGSQGRCLWHEWGNQCGSDDDARACGRWINAHWVYGVQGVCHQGTNNSAWYASCEVCSISRNASCSSAAPTWTSAMPSASIERTSSA